MSVLVGATKRSQLEDNLKAVDLTLSEAEFAELDRATALMPVYPNWFIQKLADQRSADALATAKRDL
jgi:diketogulonate reductase-like aldo/keto reductase